MELRKTVRPPKLFGVDDEDTDFVGTEQNPALFDHTPEAGGNDGGVGEGVANDDEVPNMDSLLGDYDTVC